MSPIGALVTPIGLPIGALVSPIGALVWVDLVFVFVFVFGFLFRNILGRSLGSGKGSWQIRGHSGGCFLKSSSWLALGVCECHM